MGCSIRNSIHTLYISVEDIGFFVKDSLPKTSSRYFGKQVERKVEIWYDNSQEYNVSAFHNTTKAEDNKMGLIKAAKDAINSAMADQWREYFYCDSLSNEILVTKAQKRVDSSKNSNTKGTDNIITNGSVIAVNEGQCMIIVDQGEITEFCADPGEFLYDSSTEPSLFYGKLGEGVKGTFSVIGRRFTFGGNPAKDQRIYFFNIKEIMENKFGTANPIPFRVVDTNIGLDLDTSLRCNGDYSFKIVDPLLFYKNVCGNVTESYTRSQMANQMKAELVTALQPALAKVSAEGIRYSLLPAHTAEITKYLNVEMSELWGKLRGVEVVSMNLSAPTIPPEDDAMIKEMQRRAVMRTSGMQQAYMAESQAEAFRNMGKQQGGTSSGDVMGNAMGMMAMNMMGNMMNNGMMNNGMNQSQAGGQPMAAGAPASVPMTNSGAANAQTPILGWTCSCGKTDNRGKFCAECGAPKPSDAGWTCSCGTVNQGKFCVNCGSKKPDGAPLYKCDKCGWEPEDPAHPPKFCPECGDIFDENDRI